ncbi:Pleiotropic regulatory protein [Microbacterium sp. C448]|uniref:DegT/DnrJ/EryC1/StrS family aminotransferase n=1 Tax=Microbacterium sp. C448 TaxID=1177594 RepID=UPI0003DE2FAE|nr:DegT/DnrJ/EryC1/StrS family aminotransferase [Microbacterium sp. C448]CDK01857.1 Pleiotropic regulatory protein [Microbacterium sp. C448]
MTERRTVPLVDLGWQTARIRAEADAAIGRVIDRSSFILGDDADAFERAFASYSGVEHCLGVGNGTDALELALEAAHIGEGDEVILPANTFAATAEAVARVGAVPVLVDCTDDYLISVEAVADALTPRTRMVAAVHLYGQAAPVEALRTVVGDGVLILEDAAQSQGARRYGEMAGSLGDVAGTSFYPGKNLGAFGDAGAVLTNDGELADTVRKLRNHGGVARYEHSLLGRNSRLDSIQAVVLTAKLAHLDEWNQLRREAANVYGELLGGDARIRLPGVADGNEHVFHLYVVRVSNRDRMLAGLSDAGIGAGIHYPRPIHLLPAFGFLAQGPGSFLRAEAFADEIVSLPMYPGITVEDQQYVAETVLALL